MSPGSDCRPLFPKADNTPRRTQAEKLLLGGGRGEPHLTPPPFDFLPGAPFPYRSTPNNSRGRRKSNPLTARSPMTHGATSHSHHRADGSVTLLPLFRGRKRTSKSLACGPLSLGVPKQGLRTGSFGPQIHILRHVRLIPNAIPSWAAAIADCRSRQLPLLSAVKEMK